MAYRFRYRQKIKGNSKRSNSKHYSEINARFSFKDEVAPKDRAPIRKRIRDFVKDTRSIFLSSMINSFLPADERDKGKYGYTQRHFGGLGFDLTYYARRDIPLSKMINLRAVNDYILTCSITTERK